jgi:hypothetical protein
MDAQTEREAKHTPGEWKASGNGVHVGGRCVAVADFRRGDEDGYKLACAHARLIAAAPDMLAALKDIFGFLRAHGYDTDLVKSVIAKAEGKE